MPVHDLIPDLLNDSGGLVSNEAGYRRSAVMHLAVSMEKRDARRTLECILEDQSLHENALPSSFRWGYKNPKHAYLLPVMDEAFGGKQKILMVARDPRDICTAVNQGQLDLYKSSVSSPYHRLELDKLIQLPESWLTLGRSNQEAIQNTSAAVEAHTPHKKCMEFWAAVWASVLLEYGHKSNFRVVRIEDLVIHDPAISRTSPKILESMMEYIGMSAGIDAMQQELRNSYAYRGSFMGHHNGLTRASRRSLERETASYVGPVHAIMTALGYDTKHYGLAAPLSRCVFSN
eukprot:CAMPEP_0117585810 /NCGR_PEP_ID=MMETSP0784-20121206/68361_1 /TAXON_ID=39447 /ORGANISM="" /LENGTH=288 /DNA_ID=CAMNT_0005386817 /DNA_START=276 /DNA_END=1142 /DNA_ORIENTATION=+